MNEGEAQAIIEEATRCQFIVHSSETWINHHEKADEKSIVLSLWLPISEQVPPKFSWQKDRIITSLESREDWEAFKCACRHFCQMGEILHIEEDAERIQDRFSDLANADYYRQKERVENLTEQK